MRCINFARILRVIPVLAALGAPAAVLAEAPPSVEEVILRAKPAIVLVTARMEADATVDCGTGRVGVKPAPYVETGTAWFVDGRGDLLTNAHVVDPAHRPLPWVTQELRKNAVEQACIDPVLARQQVMRGQRPELEERIRRRVDASRVALTYRPKITVLLSNGAILAARIVKFSAPLYLTAAGNPAHGSGRDLALLRVPDGVYPALRPAGVDPQLGEPLHILGFPGIVLNNALLNRTRTLEASVTTGTISGFDQDALGQNVIETDAPAAPGNSGGPAIRHDGSVAGVLTSVSLSPTSDNLIQGFNFLIPARDIVTFLEGTEVATPGESRFTPVWEAGIRDFFDGRFQSAAAHLAQADGLLPGLVDVSRLRAEARYKLAHPPPRAFPWAAVAVALLLIGSAGYGVIWYRQWQRNRFRIMPSEVIRLLDEGANPLLLDVRKESAHLTNPLMIPGAIYIEPGALERGDARLEVDPDRIVVAYCA
jgi:Trypsin-like peptidase domain